MVSKVTNLSLIQRHYVSTLWKFNDFFIITQILHEINLLYLDTVKSELVAALK